MLHMAAHDPALSAIGNGGPRAITSASAEAAKF